MYAQQFVEWIFKLKKKQEVGLHKTPHKLNKLNQLTSCDKVARQVDKKNAVDGIYVDVKKALLIDVIFW